jgi:hypothetical protein
MKRLKLLLGMVLAAATAMPAAAEYPEKPIELIVAFAPGGGTDVAARSIARFVEKHLGDGATIAVINKPGAGGEIGWTALSQAQPDGYTIGMINPPAFVALSVEGKAKYTMESFKPIGNIVLDPGILVVGQGQPLQHPKRYHGGCKSGARSNCRRHVRRGRFLRTYRHSEPEPYCWRHLYSGLLRCNRAGAPGLAWRACSGRDDEPVPRRCP